MLVGMLVSDIRLAGDVGDGGYSPPSSAPSSNVAEHAVDSDGRGLEPFTCTKRRTGTDANRALSRHFPSYLARPDDE